ncbi:ATP-binding cassette domain-containing protein, partial [Vibrio fortis]
MLQVKSVNQYYGESHTLWDLDMHIPEGKCTVLMGRNGVGKTTLLQCIMGLVKVESGDISLSGQSLLKSDAEE